MKLPQPLRPRAGARKWRQHLHGLPGSLPANTTVWQRGRIGVISSICMADPPDGVGPEIPQWHVSISRTGKRPTRRDTIIALKAFGLVAIGEEDNHHPGIARHFWLPLDPARRSMCQCKLTEDVITEPDGYTWTNPTAETGKQCRGCYLAERLPNITCPLHS